MARPVSTTKAIVTVVEQIDDTEDESAANKALEKVKKGLHSVKVLYRSFEECFILNLQLIIYGTLIRVSGAGEKAFFFSESREYCQ